MRKTFLSPTTASLVYKAPETTVHSAVTEAILNNFSVTIDGTPSVITFDDEEEGDGEDIATNTHKLWDAD